MRSSYDPSRREFLKKAGTTAAAVAAAPYVITSTALGDDATAPASDRIVMAGIGIGNMGGGDQNAFLNNGEVQYVAVCDVKEGNRNAAKHKVDNKYGNSDCLATGDFREILAREDIDAVHIGTPDHWHAILVIEACRHGKDVYCQKPESRTLAEGPKMVAAARRYARVVSGGSQRVRQDYNGVVHPAWKGELGELKSINVNVGPLPRECNLPEETVPPGFDWDMWLGPAPWQPFHPWRCSGSFSINGQSWRSYIDYSGGGMTDWGAHHFGGATFIIDVREYQPVEVAFHNDNGQKWLTYTYENGKQITHNRPGHGNMQVESDKSVTVEPKQEPDYKGNGIYGDFIHCVKTREKPFRDIEFAINTVAVSHLGIVAYALERSLKWNPAKAEFIGDEQANRFLDRAKREPWQI